MERLALELVDAGLLSVSAGGRLSDPSPGLAIIESDAVVVGADAACAARLKPRNLHSRFWEALSTEPLPKPFPSHLRTADLAHAHLRHVWLATGACAQEVLVAVPGLMTETELSLFLGIAAACEIPIRGLVDVAVAAVADREMTRHCLHLDLHLHRTVLTEVECGREIVRTTVADEPRVGLFDLYDTWARAIARLMVRITRFDPLHKAATEQVLYSRLPDLLSTFETHDATAVAISSSGRRHEFELALADVVEAVRFEYETLARWVERRCRSSETMILVSDRVAGLPGFLDHLRAVTGHRAVALHRAAAGSALLNHAARLPATRERVAFVTRLPAFDSRPPSPITVPVVPPRGRPGSLTTPTHVVVDGVAHRITVRPLRLGDSPGEDGLDHAIEIARRGPNAILESPAGGTIVVNGRRAEGPIVLSPGDRVQLTDGEALLVTMTD